MAGRRGGTVPIDAVTGDFNKATCSPEPFTCSSANGALCNSGFKVGKTYTNAALGYSVQVMSSTATTFTVKVSRTK